MSLLLNSTVETINGLELSSAYGRVAATDSFKGESIQSSLDWFASEAAWLAGNDPLYLKGVADSTTFRYDRETQSKDILDLAHDEFVSIYADAGLDVTKVLS